MCTSCLTKVMLPTWPCAAIDPSPFWLKLRLDSVGLIHCCGLDTMSHSSNSSSSSSESDSSDDMEWLQNDGESSDNDEEAPAEQNLRGRAGLATASCPRKYHMLSPTAISKAVGLFIEETTLKRGPYFGQINRKIIYCKNVVR